MSQIITSLSEALISPDTVPLLINSLDVVFAFFCFSSPVPFTYYSNTHTNTLGRAPF